MASDPSPRSDSDRDYSVDEMIDRLKQGENNKTPQEPKGELITREDGTQVIKVRKRKRRTQQPKKSTSKLSPKVKWSILGSVIFLAGISAVSIAFVTAKYNGRKFKESTEAKIAEISGATQSNLTKFQVTPLSAQASKYELEWDQHAFIKKATFATLKADIKASTFFSKKWRGNEIVASSGKVFLQKPIPEIEATSTSVSSPYDFASYRCNLLQLYFGDTPDSPAITDLQISQRKTDEGTYQFVGQNGITQIPNWPSFKLASGIVIQNSQDVEVTVLFESANSTTGELHIDGRIPTNTSTPLTLNISAKDYPIQEILGAELGKIMQGVIQSSTGSLSYDYSKSSASGLSFELPFDSPSLTMKGLPFLSTIQKITRNINHTQPTFSIGSGSIIRDESGIALNKLHLVSNSVMTIKGNIMMHSDDRLRGKLNIGIPASAFEKDPPKPFVGPQEGLYFVEIELSGTIHNPHDNLRELLQTPSKKQGPPARLLNSDHLLQDPEAKMEQDFDALTR